MSQLLPWRIRAERSIMEGGRNSYPNRFRMSPRLRFDCDFPPELIEKIAVRAAEIVEARAGSEDSWLTAAEAADYLRCPISRIYALTSARRVPHHHDCSRLLFRRSELDAWIERGGGRRPG
ncbi:MAG TPA: helix-turn-helix domain-containing protein [Solirubrobacterales bacterium]|nr:helix-turn-helix domain-containing protein [Solirubrobacterales bacterium]